MAKPAQALPHDDATLVTSEKPPAYARISRATEALILKLNADGKSQSQIAQMIGCSQPTVSRTLSSFQDTRELAKSKLHNSALALTEKLISTADADQILEVLDRTEVAPKKERGSGSHTGVQVIVNMPGQTQSKPPVIDLSPVPFALNAPPQGAGSD